MSGLGVPIGPGGWRLWRSRCFDPLHLDDQIIKVIVCPVFGAQDELAFAAFLADLKIAPLALAAVVLYFFINQGFEDFTCRF